MASSGWAGMSCTLGPTEEQIYRSCQQIQSKTSVTEKTGECAQDDAPGKGARGGRSFYHSADSYLSGDRGVSAVALAKRAQITHF